MVLKKRKIFSLFLTFTVIISMVFPIIFPAVTLADTSVMLSKKLVNNKAFREKVEHCLRLIDVGIKRLDIQTEIVINERTGKKGKKRLCTLCMTFMTRAGLW